MLSKHTLRVMYYNVLKVMFFHIFKFFAELDAASYRKYMKYHRLIQGMQHKCP